MSVFHKYELVDQRHIVGFVRPENFFYTFLLQTVSFIGHIARIGAIICCVLFQECIRLIECPSTEGKYAPLFQADNTVPQPATWRRCINEILVRHLSHSDRVRSIYTGRLHARLLLLISPISCRYRAYALARLFLPGISNFVFLVILRGVVIIIVLVIRGWDDVIHNLRAHISSSKTFTLPINERLGHLKGLLQFLASFCSIG
mmetsp:Transcript_15081/g.22690  ORF Transcript_15081/g.22690 Transcript_15081/m.22690 type:complete len:203 (+) Transcript_15081:230-838(+)